MFSNFSFFLVPRIFSVLVFTAFCAWGAEIKVSVIDPDARPLAGAQVRILSGSSVVASQNTAVSGEASFSGIAAQELRVQVLAAGFAPAAKAIAAGEQNLFKLMTEQINPDSSRKWRYTTARVREQVPGRQGVVKGSGLTNGIFLFSALQLY